MTTNSSCPICQGRGWYEAPYYGHFQPSIEPQACPDCNPVEGSATGCLLLLAFVIGFTVLICWGMP
jgi:hypothetical protein